MKRWSLRILDQGWNSDGLRTTSFTFTAKFPQLFCYLGRFTGEKWFCSCSHITTADKLPWTSIGALFLGEKSCPLANSTWACDYSQCYSSRPNVHFKPWKGVQSIGDLWRLESWRALTGATCVIFCKWMKGLKNMREFMFLSMTTNIAL